MLPRLSVLDYQPSVGDSPPATANEEFIHHASCSPSAALLVNSLGEVQVIGEMAKSPALDALQSPVAGREETAAIVRFGISLQTGFARLKVRSVSCGWGHVLAVPLGMVNCCSVYLGDALCSFIDVCLLCWCVVLADGLGVFSWGCNQHGQLGAATSSSLLGTSKMSVSPCSHDKSNSRESCTWRVEPRLIERFRSHTVHQV